MLKGKKFSEEHKQNWKISRKRNNKPSHNKGKICIFNRETNVKTYIRETDLEEYRKLGWEWVKKLKGDKNV